MEATRPPSMAKRSPLASPWLLWGHCLSPRKPRGDPKDANGMQALEKAGRRRVPRAGGGR